MYSYSRPRYNRGPNQRSVQRGRGQTEFQQTVRAERFIKPATTATVAEYRPKHGFGDFDIHPLLKTNVAAKGFEAPLQIQDQAIPDGLAGRDVIGIANTGTGKTIAFAIPVLNRLLTDEKSKALIIAPTRELAEQIESECHSFAKASGLYAALLIGGASMAKQIAELAMEPRLVVGTPGRIKDHLKQGKLRLSGFNIVVLDEVDRMLDMGFITDIRFLLNQIVPNHQSFFFTATLDTRTEQLIKSFTTNPVTISAKIGETNNNVNQDVVRYQQASDKIEKLHDLLIGEPAAKVLIFDATKHGVERLSKELQSRGFQADSLHGGKNQSQRTRSLNRFRSNQVNILVATDVAARGIDITDITHVINYSTPNSYDDYIHRIGRAGRAGRAGHALTFVSN